MKLKSAAPEGLDWVRLEKLLTLFYRDIEPAMAPINQPSRLQKEKASLIISSHIAKKPFCKVDPGRDWKRLLDLVSSDHFQSQCVGDSNLAETIVYLFHLLII